MVRQRSSYGGASLRSRGSAAIIDCFLWFDRTQLEKPDHGFYPDDVAAEASRKLNRTGGMSNLLQTPGGVVKRIAALITATLAALMFPIQAAFASCHVAKFVPNQYDIKENQGTIHIGVQNPGATAGDRTVDWETVSGSAKAGGDFVASSGTLTFTPRDRSKMIEISIVDDNKYESREVFSVRLIARPGSCISQEGIGPPATVSINDDDTKTTKPTPTPVKTNTSSPATKPNAGSGSSPAPTPTDTPAESPSPLPSPSASPSPSPSPTVTAVAVSDQGSDGGLSGGALVGIIGGVVVLGGTAMIQVRRRFLTNRTPA